MNCKQNDSFGGTNMSDLAATNCGCSSEGGCNGCSIIWILLLLSCCGGCGCGNNNNGCNSDCWLVLILLFCCGGWNNNGCGCGNSNNCGCGCLPFFSPPRCSGRKSPGCGSTAPGLFFTRILFQRNRFGFRASLSRFSISSLFSFFLIHSRSIS